MLLSFFVLPKFDAKITHFFYPQTFPTSYFSQIIAFQSCLFSFSLPTGAFFMPFFPLFVLFSPFFITKKRISFRKSLFFDL